MRRRDLFAMDGGLGPILAGIGVVAGSHYLATAAGGVSPLALAVRFASALIGGSP